MRQHSSGSWIATMLVLAGAIGGTCALAQSAPEKFVATGTAKSAAGAAVTAPVEIAITRWTTDAERDKVVAALTPGGHAAVKPVLAAAPSAGTIQLGDRSVTVRFARALPTSGGRVITVVAAEPLLHMGAGLPDAKPREGYDFAVVLFEVDAKGNGKTGDFSPAAKLAIGSNGGLTIQDYGSEAIRLSSVSKK